MKLKSFGCSFIFGTDLSDDGNGALWATPSKLTWPAHLANHLEYQYICYARPGIGNLSILDRVLNQAGCNEQSLFVIGWTWIDRFDHTDHKDDWLTLRPNEKDSNSTFYFKNLHSEYRDKLSTLMCMRIAIDTLKEKNCPFIMTYMDDLTFDSKYHAPPGIMDLQNYIRPYMTRFEDKNLLEWSQFKGYPISDTSHPLEQAHLAAFDLIKDIKV